MRSNPSLQRTLSAGAWQGFPCSMSVYDREHFERALATSGEGLLSAIQDLGEWSSEHDELLLAVSEHEVMHEGQIIRHMYGLGRDLLASWRWA
jgi:hypothetical protein